MRQRRLGIALSVALLLVPRHPLRLLRTVLRSMALTVWVCLLQFFVRLHSLLELVHLPVLAISIGDPIAMLYHLDHMRVPPPCLSSDHGSWQCHVSVRASVVAGGRCLRQE
jgi:hypothetical protein